MLRWLPEDVSPYGAGIDSLFYFIYYLTAVAFIVVTALMLIFLYVYRDQGGRRATYTHGNTALEIIWTIIPAIIFIGLGLASRSLWEDIKLAPPETDTVVKVTGKQFNWEILYPGPDGEFDTADDKQVDNDIRVPAGKPIRVLLHSKDVIHSFFLPNLRFKQDTVPGREITGWFQANKPGRYEIPCAELCGFGHSGMVGWLYALAPDEYQAWQNEQWPQVASSNGAAATNGSTETATTETAGPAAEAESTKSGIAAAATTAVGAAGAVQDIAESAQKTAETAQDAAEEAQEATTEAVQDGAGTAQDAIQAATEAAQAATDAASATTEAGTASDAAEGAADSAQDAAGEAAQTATEAAQDATATTVEEATEAAEGAATDAMKGAADTAQDTAEDAQNAGQTSQGAALGTTSETGNTAQETTTTASSAVAAATAEEAATVTAIGSATQEASDIVSTPKDTTSSAVQETPQATRDAAETADQTVQISAAQISTPAPETLTPAAQEAPAEGSSSEATIPASDQESSADASSNNASSDETGPDSPKKYTFAPAEPGGTCQGELEIVSGATIYQVAQEFYGETKVLLGVDLIRDYNSHIANLDNIYPGQKLCIPTLNRATRVRQSKESGSYKLILDSFRSTRKAQALIRQVKQKGYEALLTVRQVSDSLLLKRVEVTGLQDQTAANQAWVVLAPANAEDLS